MHAKLFANQHALRPDNLLAYGESISLDGARFKACLDGGKYTEKVKQDVADGQRLGVTGTPSFFLGVADADGKLSRVKRMRGAQPFSAFKQEIDALLASQ